MKTFSQIVKDETLEKLQQQKISPCCMQVFLATSILNSEIVINQQGLGFCITSANLDYIKYICSLTLKLYNQQSDIVVEQLSKTRVKYVITLINSQLLNDCKVLYYDQDGLTQIAKSVEKYMCEDDCCKKTFVKACFLVGGSLSLPESSDTGEGKTGYHLEFSLNTLESSVMLQEILSSFGINSKSLEKKDSYIVYIKESDAISDCLKLFNASQSMFKVEDLKINRSMRNKANRQANCTIANIDKSTESANKQMQAIHLLIAQGKMNLLDDKLKQFAEARIEHPYATIAELATLLNITKSGAVHRMNKLLDLAKEEY
ncbi:MAG: DNA-binding protein WhiA [Clostridia bacterium]